MLENIFCLHSKYFRELFELHLMENVQPMIQYIPRDSLRMFLTKQNYLQKKKNP